MFCIKPAAPLLNILCDRFSGLSLCVLLATSISRHKVSRNKLDGFFCVLGGVGSHTNALGIGLFRFCDG